MKSRDEDLFSTALALEKQLQRLDARSYLRKEVDELVQRAIVEHRPLRRVIENFFDLFSIQTRLDSLYLRLVDPETVEQVFECARVDKPIWPINVAEFLDELDAWTLVNIEGEAVFGLVFMVGQVEIGRMALLFTKEYEGDEVGFLADMVHDACEILDNFLAHRILMRFPTASLSDAIAEIKKRQAKRTSTPIEQPRLGFRGEELNARIASLKKRVAQREQIERLRASIDLVLESAVVERWSVTKTLERSLDVLHAQTGIVAAEAHIQSETPFATHIIERSWGRDVKWLMSPQEFVDVRQQRDRWWTRGEGQMMVGLAFDFDDIPWGWLVVLVDSDEDRRAHELREKLKAWSAEVNNYLGLIVQREYGEDLRMLLEEIRHCPVKESRSGAVRRLQVRELMSVSLEVIRYAPLERVRVAVIDSGVDPSHESLGTRVIDAYTLVQGDDGVDLVRREPSPWNDEHGHGTSVASVITRYAPNTDIIDIQVLDRHKLGGAEGVIAGFEKAIELGVDVINISIAVVDTYAEELTRLANRAYEQNILVVASSNNNASAKGTGYPAALSTPISIAQSSDSSPFNLTSRALGQVEFASHGENVLIATLDGQVGAASGTSLGTPVVTAIACLLLGLNPELRTFEIKTIMRAIAGRDEDKTQNEN